MWTRIDDMRHGRARAAQPPPHPGHLRARRGADVRAPGRQRGDRLPARPRRDPHRHGDAPLVPVVGNASFAQTVFLTTVQVPVQLRRGHPGAQRAADRASTPAAGARSTPPTPAAPRRSSSTRSRAEAGQGPASRSAASPSRTDRQRAVLDKVADEGDWGRRMPAGFAQGIAFHDGVQVLHGLPGRDRRPRPAGPARHQGDDRGRRRPADQPARPGGAAARRPHRRHLHHAARRPAHRGRAAARGQLLAVPLRPPGGLPARRADLIMPADDRRARAARASSASRPPSARSPTRTPARPGQAAQLPARLPDRLHPSRSTSNRVPPLRSARRPCPPTPSRVNGERSRSTPRPTCRCCGRCATSSASPGPKYGCGINVCKACTSHLDGEAFNPCVTPVSERRRAARSPRSRGSPTATTCTRCRRRGSSRTSPSAATASPARSWPRSPCSRRRSNPTDEDIDAIENVCRCGTVLPHPRGDQERRQAHVSR